MPTNHNPYIMSDQKSTYHITEEERIRQLCEAREMGERTQRTLIRTVETQEKQILEQQMILDKQKKLIIEQQAKIQMYDSLIVEQQAEIEMYNKLIAEQQAKIQIIKQPSDQ